MSVTAMRTVTLITGTIIPCEWYTMSMGAYDDDEHERRERKNSSVDASFEDDRHEYRGEIEFGGAESTAELLDQFEQLQDE